jgi:hypothetical protein
MGRVAVAVRFGLSQCVRALLACRNFAMILMQGLKALAPGST